MQINIDTIDLYTFDLFIYLVYHLLTNPILSKSLSNQLDVVFFLTYRYQSKYIQLCCRRYA